jgi:hypothetical protein
MRSLVLSMLFFFGFAVAAMAQTDSSETDDGGEAYAKPDNSGPLKLGLKLGVGYATLLGEEMERATGSIGLQGTAYIRYRFKPRFAMQAELGASFRGSRFNNTSNEYSAIRTYYIDVPVMAVIGLNQSANVNIVIGGQYSYLLNSSIYYGASPYPEPESPALKKHDVLAVLGAQFYTPFVGFQVLGKYGLIDINEGLLGDKTKPVNQGRDIRHLSIEVNFIF